MLPVGSTEQHGPHLATGTDALLAAAIAERAAAAAARPETILLAPTLAYGASDHHLPFGGTLSLGVSHVPARAQGPAGIGRFRRCQAHLRAERPRRQRRGLRDRGRGGVARARRRRRFRHGVRPRRPGRDRRAAARPCRQLRDVAAARARPGAGQARAARGRHRAAPPASVREGSSSASRGAGRSWTASPTGPTRPPGSAASGRSRPAWPPSRRRSSSSPTPVADVPGPMIAAVETTTVSARAKPGLKVRGQRVVHDASTFTLVRVVTDEGVEGFGEISATAAWSGEDAVTASHFVRDVLGPAPARQAARADRGPCDGVRPRAPRQLVHQGGRLDRAVGRARPDARASPWPSCSEGRTGARCR